MKCLEKNMFSEDAFRLMREKMVKQQLQSRGITDDNTLKAMSNVPRHQFVPKNLQHLAYDDNPLPIGEKQTISQPLMVAYMTQLLNLKGHERVLEVGTGCGYQTSILCEMADYVYTLERFPRLADKAGKILLDLGYDNFDIHIGDGSQGLPDNQPFDAIIVTAAAPRVPGPLCCQLREDGGRLVIPVGTQKKQQLQIIRRQGNRLKVEKSIRVRFVPLIGRYGFSSAMA